MCYWANIPTCWENSEAKWLNNLSQRDCIDWRESVGVMWANTAETSANIWEKLESIAVTRERNVASPVNRHRTVRVVNIWARWANI